MDLLGLDEPIAEPVAQHKPPAAPAAASTSGGDFLDFGINVTDSGNGFLDLGIDVAPAAAPSNSVAAKAPAPSQPSPAEATEASPPRRADPAATEAASDALSPASADQVQVEVPLEVGVKRFVTRCEGRWRVRSAPSLNSKVLGTIASGTIVYAKEETTEGFEGGSGTMGLVSSTITALGLAGAAVGSFTNHVKDKVTQTADLGALWVRVIRMEAQESGGVSEIKKDTASGGVLYALRRNALGYGLYEAGLESVEGPLLVLNSALSMELRADAQRAVDRTEEVSLTWKLLEAAESVKQMFGWADEGGVNEDVFEESRRAEDVWEVKQRENLKKAAATMARCTQNLAAKAKAAGFMPGDDVTVGLQREVGRRFAKLRNALEMASTPAANTPTTPPAPDTEPGPAPAEGSLEDLGRFVEQCLRVEKTGGWPELESELRQEIVNFSQKHHAQLDSFARTLGKSRCAPSSPGSGSDLGSGAVSARREQQPPAQPQPQPQTDLLFGQSSPQSRGSSQAASPGSAGAGSPFSGLKLLPPPPKPASSIGNLL